VSLDPTKGREIRKTRPCVVVSPDEMNRQLTTFLVAPMTTGGHAYPFRVACRFQNEDGFLVLDQLRTIDGARMIRRVGRLGAPTLAKALGVLREMFAE
jgi:mRNA interferase MazF